MLICQALIFTAMTISKASPANVYFLSGTIALKTFSTDMRPSLVQVRAQPKPLHRLCIRQSLQRLLGNASRTSQAPEIQLHTISGTSLRHLANRNTRKFCSDCIVGQNTLHHFPSEGGCRHPFSSPDHSLRRRWRPCGLAYRPHRSKPDQKLLDTCGAYPFSFANQTDLI